MSSGQSDEAASDETEVEVSGADELQDVLDTHAVVLVDFYADWCGPCKMMDPVIEGIAADTPLVVAKVDVDVNQQLASQHGVRGVPTMELYHNGERMETFVGVTAEEDLRAQINQLAN